MTESIVIIVVDIGSLVWRRLRPARRGTPVHDPEWLGSYARKVRLSQSGASPGGLFGHSGRVVPRKAAYVGALESGSIIVLCVCNRAMAPPTAYNLDMDLRPLHDRVMVKRLEAGEEKRGGIIIPDSAKEKPQQAMVEAVGSGKILEDGTRASIDVKSGDRILFGKYSGAEIKLEGQEYLILREDEILAILE